MGDKGSAFSNPLGSWAFHPRVGVVGKQFPFVEGFNDGNTRLRGDIRRFGGLMSHIYRA